MTTAENLPLPPPSLKTQVRPASAECLRRSETGQLALSRSKVLNRVVCTRREWIDDQFPSMSQSTPDVSRRLLRHFRTMRESPRYTDARTIAV